MIISFSFMLILLVLNDFEDASAAEIISINDPGNIFNEGLLYDPVMDSQKIRFYGTRVKRYSYQFYPGSDFSITGTFKNLYAPAGGWTVAINFTCIGGYDARMYDAFDNLLLDVRVLLVDGDLENPKCDSDADKDKDTGSLDNSECMSKICECIAQLEKPLDDIKVSVDGVKDSVDAVKDSVDKVKDSVDGVKEEVVSLHETTKEIKEVLEDFSSEFKTSIDYKIPDSPNVDNILEENKPVQNEKPFVDDKIYFKDEGDSPDADPGKLPKAPDVKDWDGFKPEDAMPPEKEQEKDKELDREKENEKDKELKGDKELSKDKPFDADIFKKDDEMTSDKFGKDSEMKPDKFDKDNIIGADPIQKQDQFDNTGKFDNTHKYDQTNKFGGN